MWKMANIRPVAKVGTPSGPSDFRPISIVSFLSNAFSMIRCWSMSMGSNMLPDFQYGFIVGIAPRLFWSDL
jgi:hypothetical protein